MFARFDIWVEAPAVVYSGAIIDVEVWAKVSGPMLDVGVDAMGAFRMDLLVRSLPGLFDIVEYPEFGHPYFGQWVAGVSPSGLVDVGAAQPPYFGILYRNNPIQLYSTRLHLDAKSVGIVLILPVPIQPDSAMIAWWVDLDDYDLPMVTDLDPNAELNIVGKTVCVIPAPASAALFALAGMAAARRRGRGAGMILAES